MRYKSGTARPLTLRLFTDCSFLILSLVGKHGNNNKDIDAGDEGGSKGETIA